MVTMMEFARVARQQLAEAPPHLWAVLFVELRMQFSRAYSRGVCSTDHGVDFFDNVLAGPEAWPEKGEYGENFRKMFKGLPLCLAMTEIPNGETVTACHKPKGHSGSHQGWCLGSRANWGDY